MKRIQKLILIPLLSLFAALFSSYSQAEKLEQTDPYVLLAKVAEITFNRFNNEIADIKNNPNHLKAIITDEMLPYVDYKYASFKVLGNKHYKRLNKSQRKEFVNAFKDYMITVYAQVFTNYRPSQRVEVEPPKAVDAKSKIVVVKSKIIEAGRPDIELYFKLRRNSKSGKWYAFDMDAEGISMLNSKRSQIGAAINRQGIDQVIKDLKDKSKASLVLKDKEAN
ncbi:ABC transporter substrate-binding protein [Catenovulum sp. SM1970]|uniref:MlaC/ttg2D family ABC transporter substrate-binding protein n=1 Tax=Marinifaba aquimaris TaxID=2741323 RepID=UPI0015740A40|nr:ABC transporter substrate-binding protein [Marinifaba aquimaris]NTS75900.1 ABC transporter substrate-binding protein [Marinifaba aquimaris]